MVLWGGTPWLSPPIAPQTPDASRWGSISPTLGGSGGPSTSPTLPQWCKEEEADTPGHPPVRGPACQWGSNAACGGHGSGGAAGPLCLAELCQHGELAAGVAARDLSGHDLLLPDKPAAVTSSAPRGAAPSSSLPPTAASRGRAPWEPPPGTHWPLGRAPCPAPPALLGSRPGSPGTARGCSPTAPTALQV